MAKRTLPLLSIGFRPFFLLAGLASVLLVFVWGGLLKHGIFLENYYSPANWHAHEMLFGYTVAVIAGFLLTAVRNWTGRNTADGHALAGLALLWLLGRLLPFADEFFSAWLIAFTDLAFLPCLMMYLAITILQQKKYQNLSVIALLLSMFVANVLFHLDASGFTSVGINKLYYFVVGSILVFVTMIAGRVFPFFMKRGLPGSRPISWRPVEMASVFSMLGLMVLKPFFFGSIAFVACSVIAIFANTIRVTGWYCKGTLSVPLLWVLLVGYSWMIVGVVLDVLAAFSLVSMQLSLHAMTAGCIGVITLGMMSRVSLGHTGRVIKANNIIAIAFILINIAVLFRVFVPLIAPADYMTWLTVSSGVWVFSFIIFVVYFTPILLKKRVDE